MASKGDARAADHESLEKLLDDLGKEHYVDPKVATHAQRQKKRSQNRVWTSRLIGATLGIAFVWLIIVTALGASIGYAFSRPSQTSQFCSVVSYAWTQSMARCDELVALPESDSSMSPPTQITRQCEGRDATNNSRASLSVETIVLQDGVAWSWQTQNFEDGPYIGTVITLAGIYSNSSFDGALGVTGGVGMLGTNFAGSCLVQSDSNDPDTVMYSMDLLVC
ncbi:hypothetical protein FVE85_6353 [Porphyridium purpureum]|uniref:Uncharacterized protein n=1 Tax=Porphyridium purpureum TaxID=35688 RepID=A0A5J4Z6B3_PORPP|nr:hypothetical protein FVE85_6353 [Porphyridium purpureum]|eukprot:POR8565..scf295_1